MNANCNLQYFVNYLISHVCRYFKSKFHINILSHVHMTRKNANSKRNALCRILKESCFDLKYKILTDEQCKNAISDK